MNYLEEKIHKKAQRYATLRNEEAKKIRREHKLLPIDPDPNREIYLAHYEGFKAGWRTAKKDRRDEMPVIPAPDPIDVFQEDTVREGLLNEILAENQWK